MSTEIKTTEDAQKQFNETVRMIFDIFSKLDGKTKAKLGIKYMRKKMNSGMRAQEDYAIRILGPYIWNCRENIGNRAVQVFLDRKYDNHIMKLSRTHKFDYKDALRTVLFMKEAYVGAPDDKKTLIVDNVCGLLGTYAKYMMFKHSER